MRGVELRTLQERTCQLFRLQRWGKRQPWLARSEWMLLVNINFPQLLGCWFCACFSVSCRRTHPSVATLIPCTIQSEFCSGFRYRCFMSSYSPNPGVLDHCRRLHVPRPASSPDAFLLSNLSQSAFQPRAEHHGKTCLINPRSCRSKTTRLS